MESPCQRYSKHLKISSLTKIPWLVSAFAGCIFDKYHLHVYLNILCADQFMVVAIIVAKSKHLNL